MSTAEPAPSLVVDDWRVRERPEVGDWIRALDARIHADPAAFITALETLGEDATPPKDRYEGVEPASPADGSITPERLIKDFFGGGVDRNADYDEGTADAIAEDDGHRQLVLSGAAMGSQVIKAGIVTTERRLPAGAQGGVDAIRRSGFAIYLGRVLAHTSDSA